MTKVATFTQDSAYPGKELLYDPDAKQLQVEGYGPVTVDRVRELDHVGQVQWVNESLRNLAYSLDQPAAQPTPAPAPAPQPQQAPPPPPQSSDSSSTLLTFVIALIAIVAIVAIAVGLFNALSDASSDDTADPPATTEPAEPAAPEPSSDTTS